MLSKLMTSYVSRLGNGSKIISDIESGRATFLVPINEQMRRSTKVHQIYDEDSHSSTSICEEFLQKL